MNGAGAALVGAWREAGLRVRVRTRPALPPAGEVGLRAPDWMASARVARDAEFRLSALWAEERGRSVLWTALYERGGEYVAARTRAGATAAPAPGSLARVYPAAARMERHARDLFGLAFEDHPDPRRWTRHQAWGETEFPLRAGFPSTGKAPGPTPPDAAYPFDSVHGGGVYEIPVGPVHAGVIEPGHFRFQALGEEVLSLEERLGYVHKGIEKIAEGRNAAGLVRLAARVSGDSAVAHAWAAAMAIERAAGVAPGARAIVTRAILAEVERIVNHLWDIGAICNDVAFAFAYYQFGRVVEDWRRLNAAAFGHRLLMDTITPGGVSVELGPEAARAIARQCIATRRELADLWPVLVDSASLHDRLAGAGVLTPSDARALGVLGFVGRASGLDFDVRRDAPYAPYDGLEVQVPCFAEGDVLARTRVRQDEILASLTLVERLLEDLGEPAGALPVVEPADGAEGIGVVDGWRGEIVAHVRFAAAGRVSRYFPRDPSWFSWPALERLIHGNIVPDFPVCNKSVNGSYSGQDL